MIKEIMERISSGGDLHRACLVVDDNEQVLSVFQQGLEKCGVRVYVASTAEEALRIINETIPQIQLFFIDLCLNKKGPMTSGKFLIRSIRKYCPWSVIIAMSGYIQSMDNFQSVRSLGVDDIFIKPFRLQEICDSANYELAKINRWVQISRRS
jgi:DNA-binding response OmpR family regulator